mgnify:CR=1 FL=1
MSQSNLNSLTHLKALFALCYHQWFSHIHLTCRCFFVGIWSPTNSLNLVSSINLTILTHCLFIIVKQNANPSFTKACISITRDVSTNCMTCVQAKRLLPLNFSLELSCDNYKSDYSYCTTGLYPLKRLTIAQSLFTLMLNNIHRGGKPWKGCLSHCRSFLWSAFCLHHCITVCFRQSLNIWWSFHTYLFTVALLRDVTHNNALGIYFDLSSAQPTVLVPRTSFRRIILP